MKKLLLSHALVGCALLAASAASAQNLRGAPGVPPAHPTYSDAYIPFSEHLPEESDGQLSLTILGPEVVTLPQMKDALQTGLTQIGLVLPLYFPADFPYFNMAAEVALVGQSSHAMASALTEFMVTCEPCQEEMRDFGGVYLGTGSTATYHLLTTEPVRSLEDLEGMRLRSGGAPWSRWAENFGAVPVTLPVGDTFEAMSQGTIDGTMTSLGDLLSYRLVETTDYITMLPMGTFHGTSNFTTTLPTWQSLTPEQRAAVARAANLANAQNTQAWAFELTDNAIAAAEEEGIEFIEPPAEMVEASQDYAQEDALLVSQLTEANFPGISGAEEQVQRFLDLVEKWEGIVAETGPDAEAIADRVYDEVWSQVDYSTYGL